MTKKIFGIIVILGLFVGTFFGVFYSIKYSNLQKHFLSKYDYIQEIDRLETELKQINGDYKVLYDNYMMLLVQNTNNEKLVETLTLQVEELQVRLDSSLSSLEEFKQKNDDLLSSNETLLESISSFEAQVQNLQNEITRLNSLLEAYEQIANETIMLDFYDDDNPSTLVTTKVVKHGQTLNVLDVPNMESTDKRVFKGWAKTKDGDVIDFSSYSVFEREVFYAVYTYYYDVTFSMPHYRPNGLLDEETSTQRVEKGSVVKSPSIEFVGYIFNGWEYVFNEQTGTRYDVDLSNFKIVRDITFIAKLQQKTFEELTWSEISGMSISGGLSSWLSVGDERDIEFANGEVQTLVVLGISHDTIKRGGTALYSDSCVTIGLKNLMNGLSQVNDTKTNVGGYSNSAIREYLNTTIYGQLPEDLRSVIQLTIGKSDTEDKLFLLSATEVSGQSNSNYADEGKQYDYFKTHDWSKRLSNGEGDALEYWLRTIYLGNQSNFMLVGKANFITTTDADMLYGTCFAFCV